ncbi:anti-sigma factor [Devosia sp. CN2-171]|uniref:anti-sigma factor n=1 Tax=Devosia sp. CN2-171 TaxID=3400909 RepID=UPI003BF83789
MSTEGHSSSGEDDQVLVAEYALGLLEGGERAAVARRIAGEPVLAADLRLWRNRLSTLDNEFAEVAAPAGVLSRIENRLFGATKAGAGGLWNSLALWRALTATAAAVAVVAIGVNLLQPRVDPTAFATQLVAAIQAQEGSGVEFVAIYNEALGEVRITSLKGDAVADKDYELWYIKGDAPAVSMGVLPVNERREIPIDAATRPNIGPGTVFAVTLEQKGGSPTGVAQGPIVAVGTATPI